MLSKTNRICYTPLPTEASTYADQPTIHACNKLVTSCNLESIRDICLLLFEVKSTHLRLGTPTKHPGET